MGRNVRPHDVHSLSATTSPRDLVPVAHLLMIFVCINRNYQ
jgi:hypothetical protein